MGYITDVYDGWTKSSGVCPFPSGTFLDGRDICDWSAQFTFQTNPALIPSNESSYRGQITEDCMTTAQKAAFFARVKAGGGDVRVTLKNGKTEIPAYVHYLDKGNEKVWISWLTGINKNNPTELKVYVGNAAATAYPVGHAVGRNAVFAGYAQFLDFAQDPSGGAPQLTDLTGNTNDGTSVNLVAGDLVDGQSGMKAWEFNGSNERVNLGASTSFGSDTHGTFTTWINANSLASLFIIHQKYDTTTSNDQFRPQIGTDGSVRLLVRRGGANTVPATDPGDISTGQWYRITFWSNGSAYAIFINNTVFSGANLNFLGGGNSGDWIGDVTISGNENNVMAAGGAPALTVYANGKIGASYWRSVSTAFTLEETEYNNQNDPGSFIPCTVVFFN